MYKNETTGLRRFGRGAVIALLLCGASGGAMAAANGPDPRDAKIESLQMQLQRMNDELNQIRSSGGASEERLAAMQAQMSAFAQQLTDIKSATDVASADILTLKAPPSGGTGILSLPNGKPTFATADGRFTGNIHSVMQFDAAHYSQATLGPVATDFRRSQPNGVGDHARQLNSGTDFRRARFGIDGKIFGDFEYGAIYEFGGSGAEDAGHIHELWLQYSGFKPFHLKVGAFEPLIGLEANVSTGSMLLMERPSPAEVGRNVAAGDSRSAVQLYANGDLGAGSDSSISAYWMGSLAVTGNTVGTLNSLGGFGSQPYGEQSAVIGRVAIAPFHGSDWLVHVGAHGQYVFRPNNGGGPSASGAVAAAQYTAQFRDRGETRVDGTRLVDTGGIDAAHVKEFGLEGAAQVKNLYVEGEYFDYSIDRYVNPLALASPHFTGYYVEGGYVLTGESRRYNRGNGAFDGPAVNNNFNPKAGTYGAFELAGRYSHLNLNYHPGVQGALAAADNIRGGEQEIFTAGLNWYLNPTVRFMFNYQHVNSNRLAPNSWVINAVTNPNGVPAGAQVGQSYDAVEVRSQLQF